MKDYKLAGIGKRVAAFLIDYCIYLLSIFVFCVLFGNQTEGSAKHSVSGLPAFVLFLIGIYLWVFSEALYGQTFGKKIMNIKVVDISGREIKTSQAVLRFLFALIDLMLLIGLIISFLNKKKSKDW